MSQKVILESTVKADRVDQLIAFLQANLPNVRGFKGCLKVAVYLNKDDQKMVFDEEWLSVEHHKWYIDFIAANGVMAELVAFLESPPEITYLNLLEV